jgi:hypothetical protein
LGPEGADPTQEVLGIVAAKEETVGNIEVAGSGVVRKDAE